MSALPVEYHTQGVVGTIARMRLDLVFGDVCFKGIHRSTCDCTLIQPQVMNTKMAGLGVRLGLVSLLFCGFISQSHQMTTTTNDVTISSLDDCQRSEIAFDPLYQYSININFDEDGFACPEGLTGFTCGVNMAIQDPFDAIGSVFCVDVKDVADSLPNTQFAVDIYDDTGDIKTVYESTSFGSSQSTVVCGDSNQKVSVMLRTVASLNVCPDILPFLVDHDTQLGTILMKEETPTRTLTIGSECTLDDTSPLESQTILKIILEPSYSSGCSLFMLTKDDYRLPQICLSFEYLSDDYSCTATIDVEQGRSDLISLSVPSSASALEQYYEDTHCFEANTISTSDSNTVPELVLRTNMWRSCEGKFALGVTFTETYGDKPDNDEDEDSQMRNLYMAVFIAVVSVCVLIMGLVCIFCIRKRARLAQAARERAHRGPSGHRQYDMAMHGGSQQAFWTSASSDQIFGLPTYEEVTGGVNPSCQEEEGDKPPAYDTICVGDTMQAPPLPPEQQQPTASSSAASMSSSRSGSASGPQQEEAKEEQREAGPAASAPPAPTTV